MTMSRVVLIFTLAGTMPFASAWGEPLPECRLTAERVGTYECVEVRFSDPFSVDNADDPRQVDVQAVFRSPVGVESRVPGFLYTGFAYEGEGIVPQDESEWRVRFTPRQPGTWTVCVTAECEGITYGGKDISFGVTKTGGRGFLRRAAANPLALEFENGDPLIAIGSNVFPQTRLGAPVGADRARTVIGYLERTAAAGGTFCRLRMDSWFIPIELPSDEAAGYAGAGVYNAQACWEVDRIVEAAERLNLTLMLCLCNSNATAGNHYEDWRKPFNHYVEENGGPLESLDDFWTDPDVRRLFLQKIRYCVARWGASPAIGVWEFFNEVKVSPESVEAMTAWHRDLARKWCDLDPYDRPITTSAIGGYSPEDLWWTLFSVPELDIVQYHTYAFEDLAGGVGAWNREILARAKKPLIVGEFGVSARMRLSERGSKGAVAPLDPTGLSMHNTIWASAMTGAVGALPWFIRNHIEPLDLYGAYTGFSRFSRDWRVNDSAWRPVDAEIVVNPESLGSDRWGAVTLKSTDRFEASSTGNYRVNRDGSLNDGEVISSILWGVRSHKDKRNPPTFEVDYPEDGQFIVQVDYVVGKAGTSTPLIVRVDGEEVLRKEFLIGKEHGIRRKHIAQYDNWHIYYNEDAPVSIPAGKHRIQVDAQGTDRAIVSYRLTSYVDRAVSLYRACALGSTDEIRCWLQNTDNTYANHYRKRPPSDAPPAELRLPAPSPGTYTVEWWDTVKGKPLRHETVKAQDGTLILPHPGTLADEACIVRRNDGAFAVGEW
ncbi:MAG: DUF5060 domain-containing protein [bacterium]|nr:DUF5060 domain-containing protein [bacterium]